MAPLVINIEPVAPTLRGVWAVLLEPTGIAPLVGAVDVLSPPFATFKTPVRTMSPVVAVDGENPVVPAEKDETYDDGVAP